MATFKKIVLGFIVTVIVAIALLPSFLSTDWGQKTLLEVLNGRIPGTITAKKISLSWFGSQKIDDLALITPQGEKIVSLKTFMMDTSFFSLLTGRVTLSHTQIAGLNATISEDSTGRTNLEESLGQSSFPIHIPGNHPITLTNVNLDINQSQGLSLKASGETNEGNVAGGFRFDLTKSDETMKWNADIKHFPVAILDAFIRVNRPDIRDLLRHLLGESISLQVHETSKGENLDFTLDVQAPNLLATINGNVTNGVLSLASPAKVNLSCHPELVQIGSKNILEDDWRLSEAVNIELNFSRLNLPLKFLSYEVPYDQMEDFVVDAEVSLKESTFFHKDDPQAKIQVKNISAKLEIPEKSGDAVFHFNGMLSQGEKPITITLDAKGKKPRSVNQWILQMATPTELQVALENVPTALVEDRLELKGELANYLGQEFSFRLMSASNDPQKIKFTLMSDRLDAPNMVLKVDQSFQVGEDFLQKDYSGHLSIPSLTIKQPAKKTKITDLEIPWSVTGDFSSITASFSGKAEGSDGPFKGKIKLEKNGSSKFSEIQLSLKGQKLPTPLLQLTTGQDELAILFGPVLSVDANVDIKNDTGPINLTLNGEQGKIHCRSHTTKGNLTLIEPLVVETQATKQLGPDLLGKFAPLFKQLTASENSIKLTVHPEKFSIPLAPFSMDQVNVGSAVLEMGKLQFRNSGEVKKLVSSLGDVRSDQISVWATPLYLSMEKGVLKVKRMDMLIMDRYPFATWGKVDLAKDNMDMIIGITGRALAAAQKLDRVDPNIMIQVPYKGHPISNAKIDTAKALTRIGAVVAQNSGAAEGIVLGTVLNLADGKKAEVPPPTTDPLPWGNLEISEKEDSSSIKGEPLKALKKGVSKIKILEELFR